MKITQILFRQHIGRHLKKHWMIQGKKLIQETTAFRVLAEKGIPIYDANEVASEQRTFEKVEIVGYGSKPVQFDKTHPHWHEQACLTFKDHNVLLEGSNQASNLTKTIITQGLPDNYIIKNSSKELDTRVKNIIMNSHILDAQQEKLEKIKDPNRPAFNFPRVYGVTNERRMKLMTSRLLQLIESLSGPQLSNLRYVLNDAHFKFSFARSNEKIQFNLGTDTILTSNTPLKPVTEDKGLESKFVDMYPVKDTITLNIENIYEFENTYPLAKHISKRHPHTIFIHFDKLKVKNIFEEEVTEDQFLSRGLMKTFTVASSYAQQEFGNKVKELPKPVVVQCVHTDGKHYHFGVLQLNTMDLETNDGIKNIWYHTSRIPIFSQCAYVQGKPLLEGYNSDVIKHLISFYDNV